jgi:hypothetical protein
MKPISTIFGAASLVAASVALAQPLNGSAPQRQPAPSGQQSESPPPPSPSDPSMTTMQEPSGGNSSATNPTNSVAPNAADKNTRLASILPAGMSSQQACQGFSSEDECATALHTAHNLNLPFDRLKEKVTAGSQLEAAVHDLKPDVDAKGAVERARQQARSDKEPPQG